MKKVGEIKISRPTTAQNLENAKEEFKCLTKSPSTLDPPSITGEIVRGPHTSSLD